MPENARSALCHRQRATRIIGPQTTRSGTTHRFSPPSSYLPLVWRRVDLYSNRGKDRVMSSDVTKRTLSAGLGVGALALLARRASADTPFSSFAFPATGAPTARTLPDRLAEIKNVKDFGAKGNGTTDDAPAINAMLQKPPENQGNSVWHVG